MSRLGIQKDTMRLLRLERSLFGESVLDNGSIGDPVQLIILYSWYRNELEFFRSACSRHLYPVYEERSDLAYRID